MKRGRESLTGGTGDVNPQYLSFQAVQSAADTNTTITQALPIQRLPTTGRSQIMEILRVYFELATNVEVDANYGCFLTTKSFGTTGISSNEPTCFAYFASQIGLTTSGMFNVSKKYEHDCTDGAGHGILVATDNIFAQVKSAGTSAANTVNIKILYRMKNVNLAEYIGIVQSQQ